VETLSEQTPQGYHLFFVCEGLDRAVGNGCEFKTSSVCMVSPSVHPSSVVYRIVNDAPIITLDGERARTLFTLLSEQPRSKGQVSARSAPEHGKNEQSQRSGVIARIKVARSIVDKVSATRIKLRPRGKSALVGLCPFHEDHSPSL